MKDEAAGSNHCCLLTYEHTTYYLLTRRTSWKLVANPGWHPRFPTSFQLVRLVGCGVHAYTGVESRVSRADSLSHWSPL